MKSRLSLIFAALVVILASMIWVVRDRGSAGDVAIVPAPAPAMEVQILPPSAPIAAPVPVGVPAVATALTVTPTPPEVIAPEAKPAPVVHVTTDGTVAYTARDGDTVSNLAVALRGSDSKTNRDAVIAADPSLQNNPDRVLTGQTYRIPPAAQATAAADAVAPATDTPADVAADAKPDSQRNLKYTAQEGDNVAVLAASLLGADTKTNRDALIGGNASLVKNPDLVVVGKTYNITTTNGLSAAPGEGPVISPTTQPDADDAARISVGRVLRYTAQPGDSVSKLATVLLGSDTQANRDAIIANNRSLQKDPDHLVAGQTYWISAPTADTTTP